mgnify:FL=1
MSTSTTQMKDIKTMPYLEKIIFAIDKPHDIHVVACFTRFLDTQRALGHLKGAIVPCIGHWEGVLEPSYMLDAKDYYEFVHKSGYVDNQLCILHVPANVKEQCETVYRLGGLRDNVGAMACVNKNTLNLSEPWTYIIETELYFQCKK